MDIEKLLFPSENILLHDSGIHSGFRLLALSRGRQNSCRIHMQLIDYIVLVSYFAVMVLIGLWVMRVNDQEDYFMGGRGFGKLMQTFAAFGTGARARAGSARFGRVV